MDHTIIENFEDLNLEDLFYEFEYSKQHELIKSSKEKVAILYQGYYYNHKRDNKDGSSIYKCRELVNENGKNKECIGVLKLTSNNTIEVKSHHQLCKAMHPIEEILRSVEYEKANLGKAKPRRTKNELKDANINILKLRYVSGELEMMDFLMEVKQYVKEFE